MLKLFAALLDFLLQYCESLGILAVSLYYGLDVAHEDLTFLRFGF